MLALCLTGSVASAADSASANQSSEAVDYVRDIRPVLSAMCFKCHGPDEATREADLRLDTQTGQQEDRGGYAAVVPGDASAAELISRILTDDPDLMMPPPSALKQLSADQKQLLIRWINEGAVWEPHWSFVAPERPAIPELSESDRRIVDDSGVSDIRLHHPVDLFLQRKLRAADSFLSPPADSLTQIRRAALDLVGLPPAPDEADRWQQRLDSASSTQERDRIWGEYIDSLLASPRYGERWARRWLDLARYADSNGYEKDRDRSIWPYRDWVIRALNNDMPFDQFTIEQIAGDLLPDADLDQRIATGFHRNTMLNEEGGIDPLEFRFYAMTDRVATTGTTWLGLTTGCAQCHTHKYDPLTHTEYYRLLAFMNNCDEPQLSLPPDDADEQMHRRQQQAAARLQQLPDKWPANNIQTVPLVITAAGMNVETDTRFRTDENFVTVQGPNPDSATYVIELTSDSPQIDGITLRVLSDEGTEGPGRTAHGNFVLTDLEIRRLPHDSSDSAPLKLRSATATFEQDGFPATGAIDGDPKSGWGIGKPGGVPKEATLTILLDEPIITNGGGQPVSLQISLAQDYGRRHTIGKLQLHAVRSLSDAETRQIRQEEMDSAFADWCRKLIPAAVDWITLTPASATSTLPLLQIQTDGSIYASGDTAKQDTYRVQLKPSRHPVTAIRLEALPDPRLPAGGPGFTYYEGTLGDFFLGEIRFTAAGRSLDVERATESFAANRFGKNPVSAALSLDGDVQTGWSVHGRQAERHTAVYQFREPIPAGTPVDVEMIFGRHFSSSLGRFRFQATSAEGPVEAADLSDGLLKSVAEVNAGNLREDITPLKNAWMLQSPKLQKHAAEIKRLLQPPTWPTTLIFHERPEDEIRPTYRHHRGEYLQPEESVTPGVPAFLPPLPATNEVSRLQFARWLVGRKNPLTARVTVNRHWQALFGRGIVETVDDFGLQGASPSHPDLLDWLAVQWMDDQRWSVKSLHRLLTTSHAYRQSAVLNEESRRADPDNRLFGRATRFRLDAEVIRDSAVWAAGRLHHQIGGPPVRPLQPAGITEVAFGSPRWNVSSGTDRYRRSLYTFVKRTAPYAMTSAFDAPSGEACIAERDRSNNPLQALTQLNDVMYLDLARQAAMTETKANGPAAAEHRPAAFETQAGGIVLRLFRRLLTRPPTESEREALIGFVLANYQEYRADTAAAAALLEISIPNSEPENDLLARQAAVASLMRILFSLDETVVRP